MQDSVEECGAVRVVCGQERLGAGGALSLRKGVGGYGGFSRRVRSCLIFETFISKNVLHSNEPLYQETACNGHD